MTNLTLAEARSGRIAALDQLEAVACGSHSASQEAWRRELGQERC